MTGVDLRRDRARPRADA